MKIHPLQSHIFTISYEIFVFVMRVNIFYHVWVIIIFKMRETNPDGFRFIDLFFTGFFFFFSQYYKL